MNRLLLQALKLKGFYGFRDSKPHQQLNVNGYFIHISHINDDLFENNSYKKLMILTRYLIEFYINSKEAKFYRWFR
jgi:hypothetical protein